MSKLSPSTEPNPQFLRRAIALATENARSGSGGPFAAVIVRDGSIVGEGVNTVTSTYDPTAKIRPRARFPPCNSFPKKHGPASPPGSKRLTRPRINSKDIHSSLPDSALFPPLLQRAHALALH